MSENLPCESTNMFLQYLRGLQLRIFYSKTWVFCIARGNGNPPTGKGPEVHTHMFYWKLHKLLPHNAVSSFMVYLGMYTPCVLQVRIC